MDRRLQLIAHLYDEEVDGLEPLGSLLEDPELRREYEALGETRFRLERGTTRSRPEPAVIDRVVNRARGASPGVARRDRPALRLVSLRRAWIPSIAVAASLLLVVIVQPWRDAEQPAQAGRLAEAETDALTDPPALAAGPADAIPASEVLLMDLPPAPPAPPAPAAAESGTEPDWDTGDEVRLLSRRIATLREIPLDAWDTPAVPLEAIPSGKDGLLTPAGAIRPRY